MMVEIYQPLDGLDHEHHKQLMEAFTKSYTLSRAFTVGPGAEIEAWRQGFMAVFNKAEELGLIINPEETNMPS